VIAAILILLAGDPMVDAERLASEAQRTLADHPDAALGLARKALALTADFEPTAFVKAGRKGEVVEDAYLEARHEYRLRRAKLYQAVGECLERLGRHEEAVRHLTRAFELDPAGASVPSLARSLVAAGRGRLALDLVASRTPGATAALQEAADATGVPSAQAEIDHRRIETLSTVQHRDGPFVTPPSFHLPSGEPFRLTEPGVTAIYVADAPCRFCSTDLEVMKRSLPATVRVALVPEVASQDQALRQVLGLYHLAWPLVLGENVPRSLHLETRDLFVVAREGWSGAVLKPPFAGLAATLSILQQVDLKEARPRASWNHSPVERRAAPAAPGLLPEGLAPGEDEPPPEAFLAAVAAFRGARYQDALSGFAALEAKGDWLLPPEARLDRALCLSALGRREEARRLLLRTGDSRFQDAVDHALETVGSGHHS
jgi:tetratricopeptide (TPR) repeat protein